MVAAPVSLKDEFKETMKLFTLTNVHYKDILKFPDIEIPKGLATFISGESGSGKSTLLKLLNGVLSVSDGEITYQQKNLESYDPIQLRHEVLLVSQSVYLFDKSIKENFDEFYRYLGKDSLSEDEMKRYLEICSASLPLDSMCQVLSGGERQRVFIAINLSFHPKVLMMDEPTSALDDKNADILIENIKDYCEKENITLIVVSHDKELAKKYAEHLVVLSEGVKQ